MIVYPCEIPLPGRVLAPTLEHAGAASAKARSIGFVAGEENRLVASTVNRLMRPSAGEAGESVGRRLAPNLLVLFGATCTGKTHLAQGLVRFWNRSHSADSAAYITASDFYRQLIDAMKRDAVADFRRAMRGHKLLAIDDVHQLPSADYLSHELRATLDAHSEGGGTIIVTSRRHPLSLANISPDVRSRLSAGLTLQLAPPGDTARMRIIRRAAESLGESLSDETVCQLAKNVSGTANHIFGAVFEFCTAPVRQPSSDDGPCSHRLSTARVSRRPDLRQIVAAVARYSGLTRATLKSNSRQKSIVAARALVVYLARHIADATYEQIGLALGGRDHTTIIHSYRKIEKNRSRDPAIQEDIDELSRIMLGQSK